MAVIWAVGWSATAFGLIYALSFFMPGNRGEAFWGTILQGSLLAGASGFVSGTVFSVALTTFFRERNLGQMRPGRMALLGTTCALLIPGALYGLSLLIGMTINGQVIAGAAAWLAITGGLTGGGIIKVAQLAGGGPVRVEEGDGPGELAP